MYYRDPKCVFVEGESLARANLVVGWLAGHGIAAEVMNELTYGGFEGLTAMLPGKLSLRGIEVWVTDPADADRARQLLAQQAAEVEAKANRTGMVEATCEECGTPSTFPAAEQGTIQDCRHCGAMIDVPDPEGEWDVGEPDDAADD
jgi:Putative prokaryotic signal transducing protein